VNPYEHDLRVSVDLGELAEYARRWMWLEAEIEAKYPNWLDGRKLTIADLMDAVRCTQEEPK